MANDHHSHKACLWTASHCLSTLLPPQRGHLCFHCHLIAVIIVASSCWSCPPHGRGCIVQASCVGRVSWWWRSGGGRGWGRTWLCHRHDLGPHATCVSGVRQYPGSGSIVMGIVVDIVCRVPLSGGVMVVGAGIACDQDITTVGGSYRLWPAPLHLMQLHCCHCC